MTSAMSASDNPLTDVRAAVSSTLTAVEDFLSQAAEHKRVIEARKMLAAGTQTAMNAVEAASERAAGVVTELRTMAGKIASLPPLTFAELKRLSNQDAQAVKDNAEEAASTCILTCPPSLSAPPPPLTAPPPPGALAAPADNELAVWIAQSLHGAFTRTQDAVQSLSAAVRDAQSSFTSGRSSPSESRLAEIYAAIAAAQERALGIARRARDELAVRLNHGAAAIADLPRHYSRFRAHPTRAASVPRSFLPPSSPPPETGGSFGGHHHRPRRRGRHDGARV